MQYQFLLDATGKYTNIYIINDEKSIVYEAQYLNEKNLSHKLTKYIENVFSKLNIWYSDFNKLFLVYGPGKFSAMRISSIMIKTWSSIFKPETYIINKISYIAKTSECICIVESDGNKYFVSKYKNNIPIHEPKLMNHYEKEIFLKENSNSIIYYDYMDEMDNISDRLLKFEKVDNNFVLNYHKSPC